MISKSKRYHFIGIGGSGMSAIANVMLQLGIPVSGSDCGNAAVLEKLSSRGAVVWHEHRAENLRGADYVVVSTAIPESNLELQTARSMGLPILPRAKALGLLMEEKKGVAIAGSHGKTTTTSMVGTVLSAGGLEPTVIAGAEDLLTGENGRMGKGDFLVAEADESDGSLVFLHPQLAIVTNIDNDHLDHYGTMESILTTFREFLNGLGPDGMAFLCGDDPGVQQVLARWNGRHQLYGEGRHNDWRLESWVPLSGGSECTVSYKDQQLGRLKLNVPGKHNALNALSAVALGMEVGLPFEGLCRSLQAFRGTRRRFELIGESGGVSIYDDYAHHPREIEATLRAARTLNPKRLLVVFQPHRYTRTAHLFQDFAKAFELADQIWLTDIYPAGEKPIPGVDARMILDAMTTERRAKTVYASDRNEMIQQIKHVLQPGDLLLVMGAGDIRQVGEELSR